MIRRYGNTIFNLTKVVRIDLYNKKLTFTLQTREGISGNFMFFVGGTNREELRFETQDEATKEFNEITDIMTNYYKNK